LRSYWLRHGSCNKIGQEAIMGSSRNNSPGTATPRSAARHGSSLRELGAPLDQERAASMADEGGAAGAYTDAITQATPRATESAALVTTRTIENLRKAWPWALLAGGVLGGIALAAMFWQRRQRSRWW
jgi:hypothetical protein